MDEEAEKKALIKKEVQQRLHTYKEERITKCLEDIMDDVIEDADSIVLRNSYFDLPDSLKVPNKRPRPGQPNLPFPDFEKPAPPIDDDSIK